MLILGSQQLEGTGKDRHDSQSTRQKCPDLIHPSETHILKPFVQIIVAIHLLFPEEEEWC